LIDEVGAAAGGSPLGGGEFLLFSLQFHVDSQGTTVSFSCDSADMHPAHDVLLFACASPVPDEAVQYEGVDLTMNRPPTIASLMDNPNPVTRPGELTLTANGVNDEDGTVTLVEFYRDVNGNGTLEPGTDALLGTDTNGGDAWSWTGATLSFPLGDNTYFARAQDDDGSWSDTVETEGQINNALPTVGSLSDSPDSATLHADLVLTANDVDDPDGSIALVEFYRDANGNGTLETGADVLLGQDTDGGDGWNWTGSIEGFPLGINTYFARARDNDSDWGDAASTQGQVGDPAVVRSGASYTYTDADGDKVGMSLNGPGEARLYDAFLSRPDGTDATQVIFSGTTGSTGVTISDDSGGPGTLSFGDVTMGPTDTLGTMMVMAMSSVIGDTHIAVNGKMGMAMIMANGNDFDLTTQGGLSMLMAFGGMANGCQFDIGGDMMMVMLMKELNASSIAIHGEAMIAMAMGGLHNGSSLTVDEYLMMAMIMNGMENSTVTFGGGGMMAMVMGGMTNNSLLDVNGDLTMAMVMGGMDASTVDVEGKANMTMVMGGMSDSSSLQVGGNLGMGMLMGGMDSSIMNVGGDLGMTMIMGGMDASTVDVGGGVNMAMIMGGMQGSTLDVGTPGVGGNLGMGMIMGGTDNSNVNVEGNANMLMLMSGNIANGSNINVSGDAGMTFLMGNIVDNSTVKINGKVDMLFGFGAVGAGARVEMGDVKMSMLLGEVSGTIVMQNGFTGSMMLFKGIQAGGGLQVEGNFEGKLSSFKDLLCDVDITGDMSGDLIATLFGDVTIQGSFSGRIGNTSTKPGTGNTLNVVGGTVGGGVIPDDAFENYAGYP